MRIRGGREVKMVYSCILFRTQSSLWARGPVHVEAPVPPTHTMRARARTVVQLPPDRYIADKGTVAVDEDVLPKDYHLVCDLTFDVSGVSVSSIYPETNRSVCLPQLLGLATETSGCTMEA